MKDNLEKFNAAQREAIRHRQGPALVLAGPGSGKTAVLTKRLQYLITQFSIRPEEILVVTFTKAAAVSMQRRFQNLMGERLPVAFGTFHSVFYRILRESAFGRSLTLLEEKEKIQFLQTLLRRHSIDLERLPCYLEEISRYKNSLTPETENSEGELPFFAEIRRGYQELCRERRKIDFDDMAYETLQLFQNNLELLRRWQRRFSYILVDEYQDIAPIQEAILSRLALPQNNLFAVGDDDQSIYGFRGAGTELMLGFAQRYPGAKEIRLEINYRCRPEIIEAAAAVISENKMRFAKRQLPFREGGKGKGREEGPAVTCRGFPDREEEYAELVRIVRRQKSPLSKTAVLFRKNADAERLTALLRRERIPCAKAGKRESLSEHAVVQDILAYLRLIGGDDSRRNFFLLMNRPDRRIQRAWCEEERVDWKRLRERCRCDPEAFARLKKLEADVGRARQMSLYAAVMYIRKGMGYERYLETEYGKSGLEKRREALELIQKEAGKFERLEELETYIAEKGREIHAGANPRKQEEAVAILTYHGSKGLEFDRVILPDLNEGCVPHKKAVSEKELEEERRMFYVAMTRAKQELYLFYRTGSKDDPEEKSRFLRPVPETPG